MDTAIKHPVPDRVRPSFVTFDVRALTLKAERQCPDVEITNDGSTRSDTGCFIHIHVAVSIWQQWASKVA